MTSSGSLIGVEVDNEGIANVTMQRPPVNSVNLDLLQDLSKTLDRLEKDKCRAMILTSSSPTVFSAGLDIMEFYKPEKKRLETFWSTLQDVWIKLFGSSFITAAAINGHAPAGGCLLALSCEYRVMVSGKFIIAMNESALGIVTPNWFMSTTTAKMFTVDEALKIGLIDETAAHKAEAIEKCRTFIKKFDRIPSLAGAITKQKIRAAPLVWMQENRADDLQEFCHLINTPNVQETLDIYINNMKKKTTK